MADRKNTTPATPNLPKKDRFEKKVEKTRNFERVDSAASSLIKKGMDAGNFNAKKSASK
jgi:hypothetical protein